MKGRRALIVVLTGLAAWSLVLGCERIPGKPTEAQRPLLSSQVSNFDELYGRFCAGCHGGDGQLGAARPLRDPLYLALVHRDTACLGERCIQQVGADRRGGRHIEIEQDGRHQRTAANTGKTYDKANRETGDHIADIEVHRGS